MTTANLRMPTGGRDTSDIVIAAGSAISTDVVRVQLDDGNAANKLMVINALHRIIELIEKRGWPL